jgi:transcription elongation factor Elf1
MDDKKETFICDVCFEEFDTEPIKLWFSVGNVHKYSEFLDVCHSCNFNYKVFTSDTFKRNFDEVTKTISGKGKVQPGEGKVLKALEYKIKMSGKSVI